MNKLKILFAFLLFGMTVKVSAGTTFPISWNITEVSAASGTVFKGAGWVKDVFFSTGAGIGTDDWFILLNTQVPTGLYTYDAFVSSAIKSPAIRFQNVASSATQVVWDFGFKDPVYFSTGCFVYKTAGNAGEGRRVFIKWVK